MLFQKCKQFPFPSGQGVSPLHLHIHQQGSVLFWQKEGISAMEGPWLHGLTEPQNSLICELLIHVFAYSLVGYLNLSYQLIPLCRLEM